MLRNHELPVTFKRYPSELSLVRLDGYAAECAIDVRLQSNKTGIQK